MPFIIDYTPAGAVGALAEQAGQAQARSRQLDFQRQLDLQASQINHEARMAGFQARQQQAMPGGGRAPAGGGTQRTTAGMGGLTPDTIQRMLATEALQQIQDDEMETATAVDRTRRTTAAREEVQADFDRQQAQAQEATLRQSLMQQGIVGQAAEQELARWRAQQQGFRPQREPGPSVSGTNAKNMYTLAMSGNFEPLLQIMETAARTSSFDSGAAATIAEVQSAMQAAVQDMTVDQAKAMLNNPSLPDAMRQPLQQKVTQAGSVSVNNPTVPRNYAEMNDDLLLQIWSGAAQ